MLKIRKPTTQTYIMFAMFFLFACIGKFFIQIDNSRDFYIYMVCMGGSLFFISLADLSKSKSGTKLFLVLGIFVMGLLMAFRNQIGIDDSVYKQIYQGAHVSNIFSYFASIHVEKGYLLLNYVLYRVFGNDYNYAQIIIAYVTFLFFYLSFKKEKSMGSIAISAFFLWTHYYLLIMGAGLVRMFLAIAIVYYALGYLWRNEISKYCMWIIIAALFHMSSLIMLLFAVFMMNKSFFYKHWKSFVVLLIIVIPIAFLGISRYIVPHLGARYQMYLSVSKLSFSIGNFDVLPILILGLYCFKYVSIEMKEKYTIGLLLLAFSVFVSMYSSMVSMGRIIYFANLGIVIVSSIIARTKMARKYEYVIPYLLVLYGIIYMMHSGFGNDTISGHLLPYASIFSN